MNLLYELFLMFLKLSAFAFGGGYVMIPSMIQMSEANQWATSSELTNVIALAGMSPGPVAMNAAIGFGYHVAGFKGAAAAFLGMAAPCAVIVILAAVFFFRVYNHPVVKGILSGLRPTITGIIIYAAVSLAVKNGIFVYTSKSIIKNGINLSISGIGLLEVKSTLIAMVTFTLLVKTKIHPIFLILASGVLGIILF